MTKKEKKRIVIKLGSSVLTKGGKKISFGKIEDIAIQIKILKKKYNIIIVSSGAIVSAKEQTKVKKHTLSSKQALASIGQPRLFAVYSQIFENFDLKVAQCLVTSDDFKSNKAKKNINNTFDELWNMGYIPIVNENDTVSIDEITFGDNDKLSAIVALNIGAEILILSSDVDGLYTENPYLNEKAKLVCRVETLKKIKNIKTESKSDLGTGGMSSKLEAVKYCWKEGIEVWIVNGIKNNFLIDAINKKINFTKFKKKD